MYFGGCQGGYQTSGCCCNSYPNFQPYNYYPCYTANNSCGGNNNFAIILVLFILLVIILGNKNCN